MRQSKAVLWIEEVKDMGGEDFSLGSFPSSKALPIIHFRFNAILITTTGGLLGSKATRESKQKHARKGNLIESKNHSRDWEGCIFNSSKIGN
jgi:hypothetical protein